MTLALLLLTVGCPATETVCEPGRAVACQCADGAQGTQVCTLDGVAWAACDCRGGTTTPGDSGGPTDSEPPTDTGPTDSAPPTDTTPVDPTTIDVYLLGGQSNMSGIGEVAALPPSLRIAQGDVEIFSSWWLQWPGLVAESEYGDAYFGPEVLFGRVIGDATERPVALIKHSVGGTDLARFWHPGDSAEDLDMGTGYRVWLDTVTAGLEALEQRGEVVRIAGMIWMQGESDALDLDDAAVYEENLTHLVARVRQDTGVADLPFVAGLIDCVPCGLSGREIVREAQQAVADADPKVQVIETEDLQLWTDEIHYNGPGMRTLGERFAQALLGTGQSEPVQPAIRLLGTPTTGYYGDYVVGWRFTTEEPLRITDLGWWDLYGNGLSQTHNVAIFDAETETAILTATVGAGTTGATPLVEDFRYAGVEPFELPPGEYLLGGTTYNVGDPDWYGYYVPVQDSDITYTQACYAVGSTLRAPVDFCDASGLESAYFFGPNLLYGPSETPAL